MEDEFSNERSDFAIESAITLLKRGINEKKTTSKEKLN